MALNNSETEALAKLAMSADSANWHLFMSYPLQCRLQAFEWWWANLENHSFENSSWLLVVEQYSDAYDFVGLCNYHISSRYHFCCEIDIDINLRYGFDVYIFIEEYCFYAFEGMDFYNPAPTTESIPIEEVRLDIYNTIENIISELDR